MSGTIFISKQSMHDLRTVDFGWLLDQLRTKQGEMAAVLAKAFWPYDEGGMEMLQADELDPGEFKVFAQAIREVHQACVASGKQAGMARFLETLLRDIESGARHR